MLAPNNIVYQSKLLSKGYERLVYWNECKTKVIIKIQQTNSDFFLNQILLESIDYLLEFIQIEMLLLKDL